MAIINVTQDSFYDGKRYLDTEKCHERIHQCIAEGADILDFGAMSSRPGAPLLEAQVEIDRLLPLIAYTRRHFPEMIISIDTYRYEVMETVLAAGAHMINDIRGGREDDRIYGLVARHQAAYVMMHMRGDAQSMMELTSYDDVVEDIMDQFVRDLSRARAAGLYDVILDPGVGFAKDSSQSYSLVARASEFHALGEGLLYGVSRKSFIYKLLGLSAEVVLPETSAMHQHLIMQGVQILRVHDVAVAKNVIRMCRQLQEHDKSPLSANNRLKS